MSFSVLRVGLSRALSSVVHPVAVPTTTLARQSAAVLQPVVRASFAKKAKRRNRPPKVAWDYDSKPVPDWDRLPENTEVIGDTVPEVVQKALDEGTRQQKYAVIVAKGDTLRVQEGDLVYMHKIDADVNQVLTFPDVQVVGCDSYTVTGSPVIQSANVYGVVEEHMKLKKIRREKFKKRKNYHKVWGHRQQVTVVRILGIDFEYNHATHPDPIRPLTPKPNLDDFSTLPFEEQWKAFNLKSRAWDKSQPGQNPNQFPDYLINSKNEYRTADDKLSYIKEKFGV